LSIADLVKLGAGIAQEEVKGKLAQLSGLRAKINQGNRLYPSGRGEAERLHKPGEKASAWRL
ncbi:hypothetical protein M1O47_01750, partial [Dehalococcoidia bacterium]|nr:hypothetical protein [Dehalococcoidia bacterium]